MSKVFNSFRSFRYATSMQPGFAIQSDQLVPRGYNIDAIEMMTTMITTTMTTISIEILHDNTTSFPFNSFVFAKVSGGTDGRTNEQTDGRTDRGL